MRIVDKEEFYLKKKQFTRMIKSGAVFIYPTDTIYGLGCDASNNESVMKIRALKNRPEQPFSIIAPSIEWIKKYCEVTSETEEWLKKLPGPYTLILKLKDRDSIAESVNPGMKTIGVRIPDHWLTKELQETGVPIVTTSANKVGADFMTSTEDLDNDIGDNADFIIYEGEKNGRPSQIVNIAEGKVTVKKR